MPWDSCHGEKLFQQPGLAMVSDAVTAAGPYSCCGHQRSLPRERGAADSTAFIYQLKEFKQKRKCGLTLGVNCSTEVFSFSASEVSESRVDNSIAITSQIITAKYLQNKS